MENKSEFRILGRSHPGELESFKIQGKYYDILVTGSEELSELETILNIDIIGSLMEDIFDKGRADIPRIISYSPRDGFGQRYNNDMIMNMLSHLNSAIGDSPRDHSWETLCNRSIPLSAFKNPEKNSEYFI